jgi:cytochrome c-type biogenesis protein CcmH
MKTSLVNLLLILALISGGARAVTESFDFSGPVTEQRFKSLIEELRCLVCQNESLAGSDAGLAHDLRREVYQLMMKGHSDDQIVDFLVARYGDFVLYSPPLRPSTYLLWFGPFLLLFIAGFVLFRSVSQRSRTAETQLTEGQQAQIEKLLVQNPSLKDEHR